VFIFRVCTYFLGGDFMKKIVFQATIFLLFLGMVGTVNGSIVDWGNSNELFHDTDTSLYWYDPIEFQGWSRSEVDAWLSSNTSWAYATYNQLFELYEHLPIEYPISIPWLSMGAYTSIEVGDTLLYKWEGYMAPEIVNANTYDAAVLSKTDTVATQAGGKMVGKWSQATTLWYGDTPGGAWLVSQTNPVPIPAAIYLLGAGFAGLVGIRRKLKK
jgi:hypothetical protein